MFECHLSKIVVIKSFNPNFLYFFFRSKKNFSMLTIGSHYIPHKNPSLFSFCLECLAFDWTSEKHNTSAFKPFYYRRIFVSKVYLVKGSIQDIIILFYSWNWIKAKENQNLENFFVVHAIREVSYFCLKFLPLIREIEY